MNILLVDDDENCLAVLQGVVSLIPNANAVSVTSSCEAWWQLTEPGKRFDLVVTDISMPIVSGQDLIRRIRATPALSHLPVILCSGRNDRATVESSCLLRIGHYVVKPFEVTTMLQKMQQSLGLAS